MNIALITGITGQDGSYLAELLLNKEYEVWGTIRRSSNINTDRIEHIFSKLILKYSDLYDSSNFLNILAEINKKHSNIKILEIYNLAAMSHVQISFELPDYTAMVNGIGTLHILEAIKNCNIPNNKIKFYQASTSEMYGDVLEIPQKETTPFNPRSPYAIAKLYSHYITKNYRECYNIFACSGILFNHESPRRGHNFVTRKITIALGNIISGKQDKLVLGNINSLRDWGHSKDYVYGMWLMLQQDTPDDYVLSTCEYHTVREFIEKAFKLKGFDIKWKNKGVNEIGYDSITNKELIFISDKYYRLTEVEQLLGDSTKAREKLGWNNRYTFDDLIKEMVEYDCK